MSSTKDVKQEERNWLDIPYGVMINILKRVRMADIIRNAEKVCTAWLKLCKDPALWMVINMSDLLIWNRSPESLCRLAVSRSQGQLVDITFSYISYDAGNLLGYVSERSSQLRCLKMVHSYFGRSLSDALMKFSLLEELNLYFTKLSKEEIETVGRYCPMLKTLKTSDRSFRSNDEIAIAIGQNLPELKHLELIGNGMTNIGLQVILDNCLHLETFDLRACVYIDLKGDIGKQCSRQIKYLKLPNDSLEDPLYNDRLYNEPFDDGSDYYYDDAFEIFDCYLN